VGSTSPTATVVDIQGKINDGPWRTPVMVGTSGTNGDNLPLGTTYTYRLLPHGGSTVLATFSVTRVAAPTPSFTITPSHVTVPPGATTGPFAFTWSAPGYEYVDIQGRINGGPWRTPVVAPGIGHNGDNLPVNTTYEYRFFPHGDTAHVLGTLTVNASD
jgi:hypothetical protein